jgi:serine/threonine protein kinase
VDDRLLQTFHSRQIDGLEFIHSQSLVHCDIKPENILLDQNGVAKICDFGSTKPSGQYLFDPIGSLPYMAPELMQLSRPDDSVIPDASQKHILAHSSLDVWSLAVSFIVVTTGMHPWLEASSGNREFDNFKAHSFPRSIRRKLTSAFIFELQKALCLNPRHRYTVSQLRAILYVPWLLSPNVARPAPVVPSTPLSALDEIALRCCVNTTPEISSPMALFQLTAHHSDRPSASASHCLGDRSAETARNFWSPSTDRTLAPSNSSVLSPLTVASKEKNAEAPKTKQRVTFV